MIIELMEVQLQITFQSMNHVQDYEIEPFQSGWARNN